MKIKTMNKTLLASGFALLACASMLIGTTYAWFTDSAQVTVNKIQVGKLDLMVVGEGDDTKELTELNFTGAFAPGETCTLPTFYVKNNGSLQFKYKIVVSGLDGMNGAVKWTLPEWPDGKILAAGAKSEAFTISGTMGTAVGNEAMGASIEGIRITVVATQIGGDFVMPEPPPAATAADLKAALEEGGTVKVAEDIALGDLEVTTISKDTVLDLGGKTLSVKTTTSPIVVENGAKLVIENGSLDFTGNKNADGFDAIKVTNTKEGTTTELTLKNVVVNMELNPNTEKQGAWADNSIEVSAEAGSAVLNIEEGTKINASSTEFAPVVARKNATINMNGGEVTVQNTDTNAEWSNVWGLRADDASAVVNMNGGVINVLGTHSANGINANYKGTVNFNGGTINVKNTLPETGFAHGLYVNSGATLNLAGGTINVEATSENEPSDTLGAMAINVGSTTEVSVTGTGPLVINVNKTLWKGNQAADPEDASIKKFLTDSIITVTEK